MPISYHDWQIAKRLHEEDVPFYALLAALMRKADSDNTKQLALAYPDDFVEAHLRYHLPGGCVSAEEWLSVHGKHVAAGVPAGMDEKAAFEAERCRERVVKWLMEVRRGDFSNHD